VAIKQSRASKKVQRPLLQHETRVLRLLSGHPSIPDVYGYGHLDHFEYLAMELLGPSIGEKLQEDAGLEEKTVIRIVDQMVRIITTFDVFYG
jgi:predicted Ser/Thr protein kinase